LGRKPGCNCYEGIVLASGEVGQARRIRGDMLLLLVFAGVGLQVGEVEDAVWIGAVDALGGEGLDAVENAVLKRDAGVERVELVVFVVDDIGIGEVDGEDADALGSCAT
jgi:hypothetical protein